MTIKDVARFATDLPGIPGARVNVINGALEIFIDESDWDPADAIKDIFSEFSLLPNSIHAEDNSFIKLTYNLI